MRGFWASLARQKGQSRDATFSSAQTSKSTPGFKITPSKTDCCAPCLRSLHSGSVHCALNLLLTVSTLLVAVQAFWRRLTAMSEASAEGGSTSGSAAGDLVHVSDPSTGIQRGPATAGGPPLRLCMSATVVKGFGRGSKLLGIPTANMDMKEIGNRIHDTAAGIYFGFTMLKGVVYPAVVSVGWNPYFDNEEKTLEPHLLHTFEEDFYGEKLHLMLCGFIRNELNFNSLDDLIVAINGDIDYAKAKFKEPEVAALATDHPFWAEVASIPST